ncbi:MAG: ABC transporter permease [Bdellovibrionales bacterium]
MKPIWIVSQNTFREIMRDRILYGILIFAFFLIVLSLAVGQLSYAEQTRITINFGYTAIHLCSVILSIFVGSTLVAREIDKKTILTLLARPISRTQFIIGKYLGLLHVIAVSIVLISLILVSILLFLNVELDVSLLVGLYGVYMEAAILLAITMLFGCFSTPMLSVAFAIGTFLIGHWHESLKYFSEKSQSEVFIWIAKIIRICTPDLEYFNWRSLYIYSDPILWVEVYAYTAYGLAWCIFLVTIAALILWRRDLG